jgi:translocation and assembly module TamB
MSLEPGLVYLSGKLAIEGSEIVVPDMTSSIRPSNDVRIVGDTSSETKAWRIKTDLAVSLTGDNRLRVAGFNGLLTGNMRIRSETGQLTTGEGTLNVSEGVYRAFGATVPIRRGQIEFIGGALDDPAINIVSRRVIEQREVGFDVTGTLKAPVVTLVSNPAMDQSEILSWLLYGRGEDDVSGAASAVLVDTIRQSLGSEEEESFIQRMLSRTGLANTGVEVTSDLTSGVGLSKQLSPRMRVKYQVDIWDQTTRLILRYQLNQYWALEGTSGDLGGADILYERER